MPVATLTEVLGKAMGADYGVPSFNVHNLEFIQAVMRAAEELSSPVIIAIAPVSIEYAGLDELATLARVHATRSKIPVVIHLDHGKDIETVRRSIGLGLSSVMYDGSSLPLEENIRKTREVVEVAHQAGVPVEGEIGIVGRFEDLSTGTVSPDQLRNLFTRPDDAKRFVGETMVDALAVAVGTVHRMPIQEARIDFQRLREIHEVVNVPLVFHGCTGLKNEDYRAACELGVKKFNIGTRLVKEFQKGLLRQVEAGGKPLLACLRGGTDSVYEAAKERIDMLNCAGKA